MGRLRSLGRPEACRVENAATDTRALTLMTRQAAQYWGTLASLWLFGGRRGWGLEGGGFMPAL